MTITEHSPIPVSYADPFGPEVLEDPHPFHRDLRDAGPVVRLDKYDLYAMGRYEQVHAALVNWQEFISSDGVGLLSFRNEKPWRPPSVLLEADPPAHDAPRRVLAEILGPRTLRNLRGQWFEDARKLVDEVLPPGQVLDVDVMTALAEAFPLRVFPDAVGLGQQGRENLLPYGDHLFNAFGPGNELVAKGAARAPELQRWVAEQGPFRRHHNNTMRAWESLPLRVRTESALA